jgi:hypothetical protein
MATMDNLVVFRDKCHIAATYATFLTTPVEVRPAHTAGLR